MKSRRKAREAALQALYQCDVLKDWTQACIDLYFSQFQNPALNEAEAKEDAEQELSTSEQENLTFAHHLAEGVCKELEHIDAKISAASTHWSIKRMAYVDRNIIRVAVYEILFCPETPLSVAINEAIEIAKRYACGDSSMFINGVLDQVARLHAPRLEESKEPGLKKAS